MHKYGTITPDQIEATAQKHVCNYFFVEDLTGNIRHVAIGQKSKLHSKIDETAKTIASLPDHMFVITFCKSTNGKNPAQYPYFLVKSSAPMADNRPASQPQTIINTPFEPARSMDKALHDATLIAELKAENKRLTEEIERIKLEKVEPLKDAPPVPSMMDQVGGFMQNTLPQFMPLLEKFMDQRQQRLEIDRMRTLSMNQQQPVRTRQQFRPIPQPGSQLWDIYMNHLEKLDDDQFNAEMQYVSIHAPYAIEAIQTEFTPEQNNTDGDETQN